MSAKCSIVYTTFPDGRGGLHLYEEWGKVYLEVAVETVEVSSHPNGHFCVTFRLPPEMIKMLADGSMGTETKKVLPSLEELGEAV